MCALQIHIARGRARIQDFSLQFFVGSMTTRQARTRIGFAIGATMRVLFVLPLTAAVVALGIVSAAAQTPAPKPKSPGEIAAASKVLAERSAKCRGEAKAKKLHFGKRRAFLRECMKQ
jgi:hypothetical protein